MSQFWRPLRVRSVADQVADALRLEAGHWAGGEEVRLPPETELAELLGVSRGSLRLALRQLAREGVVHSRRGAGAGTFLRPGVLDVVSVESAMAGRRALEISAVRAAAQRPEVASACERLLGEENYSFDRNRTFHEVLLRASGGVMWPRMAAPWFDWAEAARQRQSSPPSGARVDDDHRRIVEALRTGDADRAAEAMSVHLRWVEDAYREARGAD